MNTTALNAPMIAAVRQRARIVDLFAEADLEKLGRREFVTTCPWHDDHHPSLTISPARNRVYCFVCNRGEDPIGWVQDRQGLPFLQAVEHLARHYGIPVPSDDPVIAAQLAAEAKERQRLLTWRAELETRFHRALLNDLDRHGPCAQYLQQRGLSVETAREWQLGLHQGRLMLPIHDHQGRCCGFSGRLLESSETTAAAGAGKPTTADQPPPKYRNSPSDVLFQRNSVLFGLDHAAAAIRRRGEVLLVEGPLDVLQLHQAGIDHAVATMGTHLSPQQRQLLQQAGGQRIIVAFDGDGAGRRATQTLIDSLRPMAIADTIELTVLPLPDGQDPDGLLRQEGAEGFWHRYHRAPNWLSWELDQLLAPAEAAPDDPQVLQHCDHSARQLLKQLPAGGLRRWAEQRLRRSLGAVPQAPVAPDLPINWTPPPLWQHTERRALRLYMCSPETRPLLDPLQFRDRVNSIAMSILRQLNQRLPPRPKPADLGERDMLAGCVLTICPRLDPPVTVLLEELACNPPEVWRILRRDPQPELEVVLQILEPVVEQKEAPTAEPEATAGEAEERPPALENSQRVVQVPGAAEREASSALPPMKERDHELKPQEDGAPSPPPRPEIRPAATKAAMPPPPPSGHRPLSRPGPSGARPMAHTSQRMGCPSHASTGSTGHARAAPSTAAADAASTTARPPPPASG
jgi:DNA primase